MRVSPIKKLLADRGAVFSERAGVEIAFPQQDLHIRSVTADFPVRMRPPGESDGPSE